MATVACKLPNGLTIDHKDLTITLNGAHDAGAKNGYGLTPLKDNQVEWFMDWLTGDGAKLPAVERDFIFLASNDKNAADQAREQKDERTGLEGLDPSGTKSADGRVAIEPTDETKRELAKGSAKK